jgi:hypothetical protein
MASRVNPGLRASERTAPQVREFRRTPRVADLFAVGGGLGAELALRREAGFALRHALVAVLRDELVEVKLQLGVESGFLFAAAEKTAARCAQPAEAFPPPVRLGPHVVSSMLRTLLTAKAKESQCAFSTSSSLRPARVRR